MRILMFAALLVASGCATDRAASYCSIHTLGNDLARPLGLVRLDPSLEQALRARLPPEMRREYLCWYTSRQDIVVTQRRDRRLSSTGYTFILDNGTWRLSDAPPEILSLPQVIQ